MSWNWRRTYWMTRHRLVWIYRDDPTFWIAWAAIGAVLLWAWATGRIE
jgi:hypothetical protein